MKNQRAAVSFHSSAWLGILGVLGGVAVLSTGLAQTNQMPAGKVLTGRVELVTARLPAPSDFQRLQFYYAAHPASPPPGSERQVFTLKADRTWSGDWNSKVVPKPTREQLNAITPVQVDLFKRAAKYTDGAWRILTSRETYLLAEVPKAPADYELLRLTIDRDEALNRFQELEHRLQTKTME